jgi:hypothetical protein
MTQDEDFLAAGGVPDACGRTPPVTTRVPSGLKAAEFTE